MQMATSLFDTLNPRPSGATAFATGNDPNPETFVDLPIAVIIQSITEPVGRQSLTGFAGIHPHPVYTGNLAH